MPKSKDLVDSDSDSDSGPEERNPPKKAKTSDKSSGKALKNSDGETYFELDRFKRVSVRAFRGKTYVDIREFYEKDGKILPGKKGIALTPALWNKVLELQDEIDDAIKEIS